MVFVEDIDVCMTGGCDGGGWDAVFLGACECNECCNKVVCSCVFFKFISLVLGTGRSSGLLILMSVVDVTGWSDDSLVDESFVLIVLLLLRCF